MLDNAAEERVERVETPGVVEPEAGNAHNKLRQPIEV